MAVKRFTGHFKAASGSDWTYPARLYDGIYDNSCRIDGTLYYFKFALTDDEIDDFKISIFAGNNTSSRFAYNLAYGDENGQTILVSENVLIGTDRLGTIFPMTLSSGQKQQILAHKNNLLFGLHEYRSFMTAQVNEIEIDVPESASKVYNADKKASAAYLGTTKASAMYVGTTKVL